ncbi:MAG TPA: tetratricopeptide repeat protein [Burkholderiaceae bacterium]|nr:tetratricopeptide repeat protein [Burkholderiaceae bacterium]
MSVYVPTRLIVAIALCIGGALQAQPVPPPPVGDITTDRIDPTPLEEVRKLISAGQSKQALARADQHLAKSPRDAQMRFVRGVILTDMKDDAAARAVFQQLVEDFPELPEPYNNLAVLYAADGQLDRAKQSLEMALVARPDYATAHENLGDVYLQMAADAYQRASTLQPGNRALSSKLALTREMVTKARSR